MLVLLTEIQVQLTIRELLYQKEQINHYLEDQPFQQEVEIEKKIDNNKQRDHYPLEQPVKITRLFGINLMEKGLVYMINQ